MPIEFVPSPRCSVGLEMELALVSRRDESLVCAAGEVLDELGRGHADGQHPFAKQELYQSTVEVITAVCDTVPQAIEHLRGTVAEVREHTDARDIDLACWGVHPFARWYELERSPSERYDHLIDTIQWPARRLMSHGVHVHVGVGSGEKAITITGALVRYLPVFLALTASSPYWHGHDTGLASVRAKVWESLPTTGIPPRFDDWAAFTRFIDALVTAGSIETVREVWWDIRPHPDFGTVELRMCDGVPTMAELASIAALAHSLVADLDERIDAGEDVSGPAEWVARENKWRAIRYGIDASLVIDESGRTTPMRDVVEELVEELAPTARSLGCEPELLGLRDIVEIGPSYARQRRIVADGGLLRDVVASIRREFATGRPGA